MEFNTLGDKKARTIWKRRSFRTISARNGNIIVCLQAETSMFHNKV